MSDEPPKRPRKRPKDPTADLSGTSRDLDRFAKLVKGPSNASAEFDRLGKAAAVLGEKMSGSLGLDRTTQAFGSLKPDAFGSLKPVSFDDAIFRKALELTQTRYDGLIDQAREAATRAHSLSLPSVDVGRSLPSIDADAYSLPDPQAATREVAAEITRVGEIVASIADATTSFLEVARDAQTGLIRLEASAEATRVETERLRGALEAGQKSADRAGFRLLLATAVLVVLTFVIAVFTVALVLREGAAA